MAEHLLRVEELHKSFGNLKVLEGVGMTLDRGHKTALIGPSGCGKSTMLRCINYLETPTSGHVYLDGELFGERPANGGYVRMTEKESEVFRAGFAAIHHGQREAALAVGMTPWDTVRYVILPQTWRITLPPIGNYGIALLKDTAVVSAIAAPELMYRARNLITATFETTAVYVLVAAIYFCLSFPLARLVDHLLRAKDVAMISFLPMHAFVLAGAIYFVLAWPMAMYS